MRPSLLARALSVAVVATLVGYPIFELLRASVAGPPGTSASAAWGSLDSSVVVTAIVHTVVVSTLATLLATVLGTAAALVVERSDLPGRRLLGALALAPLVVPPYVGGLSWLEAYGGAGLSQQWLHVSFGWVSGPAGVTLLLSLESFPLAYLLVRSLLAGRHSVELEEAARAAGGGPWRVLREVTLPLLRPALIGSALLVFVASASDFGVPAVLGIPAGFSTITTAIYADLSFAGGVDAIGSATALSALLGVVTLVLLLAIGRSLRGVNPLSGAGRARSEPREALICFGRLKPLAAAACWAVVVAASGIPLLALLLEALGNGFQLSIWPGHWHAGSFRAALSGADLGALGRSLLLAVSAATAVALGGAAIAYLLRRGGRLLRPASALLALPFALPGSVMAVAVLLAWQRYLYGSLAIILLAYLARFAVIGVRSADAGLASLGEELIEAGRAAGASGARVGRDVVAPCLAPSIGASFGLVFLLAVHELTMSSLLYGPSTATFAVMVLNAEQAGSLTLTAALALVVTAITAAAALLLVALRRRLQSPPAAGAERAEALRSGTPLGLELVSGP